MIPQEIRTPYCKANSKADELKHQITGLQQMTSTKQSQKKVALKMCKSLTKWFALKYSKARHNESTEINLIFVLRLVAFGLFYSSQACRIPRSLTSSSGTLTRVHNLNYRSCCSDSKETTDILELERGRVFKFLCNQNLDENKVQGRIILLRTSWNIDFFFFLI